MYVATTLIDPAKYNVTVFGPAVTKLACLEHNLLCSAVVRVPITACANSEMTNCSSHVLREWDYNVQQEELIRDSGIYLGGT